MKTRIMPLIGCIALHSASSSHPHLQEGAKDVFVLGEDTCPPCDLLFRRLRESSGEEGTKMSQVVKVQLRGEPKSGTGMAFDWATGALVRTCDYLKRLFGEESCRVDISLDRTMIFEPALGGGDAACSCANVERVSIVISSHHKHTLPMSSNCSYSHPTGVLVADGNGQETPDEDACTFANGTKAHNHSDLWQCISQANCPVADDWLQMAVFRDPRPVAVSAYFHLRTHRRYKFGNMEEFTINELPLMCQWVAIRYIIFTGLIPQQSEEFWYDDALARPLAWHYRWLDFVGLQLPAHIVQAAADAAIDNDFGFPTKHIDKHPGQKNGTSTGERHFEDEVSSETREIADAILRQWLPPVLLAKLGV